MDSVLIKAVFGKDGFDRFKRRKAAISLLKKNDEICVQDLMSFMKLFRNEARSTLDGLVNKGFLKKKKVSGIMYDYGIMRNHKMKKLVYFMIKEPSDNELLEMEVSKRCGGVRNRIEECIKVLNVLSVVKKSTRQISNESGVSYSKCTSILIKLEIEKLANSCTGTFICGDSVSSKGWVRGSIIDYLPELKKELLQCG
jgi:hypothetical protein